MVYINNLKKKTFLLLFVFSCWFLLFSLSDIILNKKLIYTINLNDCLSFSYPKEFKLDWAYISKNAQNKFIETNNIYGNIVTQNMKIFQSSDSKFSFSYPDSFILSQKNFPGSEILYHIDFHSNTYASHGFVQVWNMPFSLEDFLNASKSSSLLHYDYFSSKPIIVNNLHGILWDFSVRGNDGKTYKGIEVFLKKEDKMYRISYFVPINLWNKNQHDIFWSMVNSLKIN